MTKHPLAPWPAIAPMASVLSPTAAVDAMTLLAQSTQFMSMRLDMSLKAQRDLLACKTPAEVYEVQSAYLQTALEHYNMAAKGMMDLWRDQLRTAGIATARDYDDVPI